MSSWRLLHWFFLGRAIARGPRYFAGYETNRPVRRAAYHAVKPMYGRRKR